MSADPPRLEIAAQIERTLLENQLVIVTGEKGLGQKSTAAIIRPPSNWNTQIVNGDWLAKGYLAGFHKLIDLAISWCTSQKPELISAHEQSLKRLFPLLASPHFRVPKDLTNTSSHDERTRFYHHEYQNKLLVGLAEFLLQFLDESGTRVMLTIDSASRMSPTSLSLLHIITQKRLSSSMIKFILIDYDRRIFIPNAPTIEFTRYSHLEFTQFFPLGKEYSEVRAGEIYRASRGNAMFIRALLACEKAGIPTTGYLDCVQMVDLFLSARNQNERFTLIQQFIASDCDSADYIEIRNYETFDRAATDDEHQRRHDKNMAAYKSGSIPLVTLHAWAIHDKHKRLIALAQPSDILMSIGLYDTWFSFFAEVFSDVDLRTWGSGNELFNATFLNAAFVLYALGCGRISSVFLDQFYSAFPESKFAPTALYAQAMTYGRYRQPVDLPLAEKYALLNLRIIDTAFQASPRYDYIKVFAENAYAYIKARQGHFQEALQICASGNQKMLDIYGPDRFRLHRSILIYNTSQVYELVRDYDRAEKELRIAISCDPFYGEYQNDLGNLLSKFAERAADALMAYTRAIELCPPYYEAFLNRGQLHAKLGNHDAALADFLRTLEIKPLEWRALLHIGNLHLKLGNADKALEYYDRVRAIEIRNVDLYCNMGIVLSECGRRQESVDHYYAALDIDSGHAASHNNLAVELFALGRYDDALKHATIAADVGDDPDYEINRVAIVTSTAQVRPNEAKS